MMERIDYDVEVGKNVTAKGVLLFVGFTFYYLCFAANIALLTKWFTNTYQCDRVIGAILIACITATPSLTFLSRFLPRRFRSCGMLTVCLSNLVPLAVIMEYFFYDWRGLDRKPVEDTAIGAQEWDCFDAHYIQAMVEASVILVMNLVIIFFRDSNACVSEFQGYDYPIIHVAISCGACAMSALFIVCRFRYKWACGNKAVKLLVVVETILDLFARYTAAVLLVAYLRYYALIWFGFIVLSRLLAQIIDHRRTVSAIKTAKLMDSSETSKSILESMFYAIANIPFYVPELLHKLPAVLLFIFYNLEIISAVVIVRIYISKKGIHHSLMEHRIAGGLYVVDALVYTALFISDIAFLVVRGFWMRQRVAKIRKMHDLIYVGDFAAPEIRNAFASDSVLVGDVKGCDYRFTSDVPREEWREKVIVEHNEKDQNVRDTTKYITVSFREGLVAQNFYMHGTTLFAYRKYSFRRGPMLSYPKVRKPESIERKAAKAAKRAQKRSLQHGKINHSVPHIPFVFTHPPPGDTASIGAYHVEGNGHAEGEVREDVYYDYDSQYYDNGEANSYGGIPPNYFERFHTGTESVYVHL